MMAGMVLGGGCASRVEEFLGGRTEDACNDAWPVCSTVAGCLLGPEGYIQGRFPGTARFIVQIAEPSTVNASVFLTEVASSGSQTDLTFYEGGCQGRVPVKVTGVEFTQEVDKLGEFARSADLVDVGDHMVEVTSDAQAEYLIKVDVTPKRDQ